MVKFNIHSIRTKIYKKYINSVGAYFVPNLLKRNFVTDASNNEGWLYCAIVKDLCTKKIVGYAFSSSPDSKLVGEALILAINLQFAFSISVFRV